ncbi:MAG: FkbM family methyltransferase [Fibrobacterota bacterium]
MDFETIIDRACFAARLLFSSRIRRGYTEDRKRVINTADFYSEFLEKDALCFDIGANRGDMTEALLRAGAGKVISVEPVKAVFRGLKKRYKHQERVIPVNTAVSSESGNGRIMICRQSSELSTLEDGWRNNGRFKKLSFSESQEISLITWQNLAEKYGVPFYAKIDTEGHEYDVIKGIIDAPAMLSFEFTEEFKERGAEIIVMLEKKGFIAYNICPGDQSRFLFDNWKTGEAAAEYLKSGEWPFDCGEVFAALSNPV